MKVIDARSGHEMQIGETISYPEGESITLLEVEPGIFRARVRVRRVVRMWPAHSLETQEARVPLQVRWTHPAFLLQHVAFLPS